MFQNKRSIAVFSALVLIALVLAACSGGANAQSSSALTQNQTSLK